MIGTLFLILPYPKIIAATAHFQMVLYSVNTWKKKYLQSQHSFTLPFVFLLEGLFIH